jgi:hypothetical protein
MMALAAMDAQLARNVIEKLLLPRPGRAQAHQLIGRAQQRHDPFALNSAGKCTAPVVHTDQPCSCHLTSAKRTTS